MDSNNSLIRILAKRHLRSSGKHQWACTRVPKLKGQFQLKNSEIVFLYLPSHINITCINFIPNRWSYQNNFLSNHISFLSYHLTITSIYTWFSCRIVSCLRNYFYFFNFNTTLLFWFVYTLINKHRNHLVFLVGSTLRIGGFHGIN